MKAAVYSEYGGPEKIVIQEVPRPVPQDGEVLIRTQATCINSWDFDMLYGRPFFLRLITGAIRRPKIKILGCDIAGIVEKTGDDVSDLKPGDRVFGDLSEGSWGGMAEWVCADAEKLAMIPNSMDFLQAAALPQAGVLAWQAMMKRWPKRGEKLLVNGAGGGVGTIALQIALREGVDVTCVDSGKKLEKLKEMGCRVVDYRKEDFTRLGETYDLIIDNVSHHSVFRYRKVLNKGGKCVIVGGSYGKILMNVILQNFHSKDKWVGILAHKPSSKDLQKLSDLFEERTLSPIIDSIFPLDRAREAFERFQSGDFYGKVVIQTE